MTFDNSLNIKIQRLTLFGASVLLLAFIALTYFERLIRYPLVGMSDTAWTILLIIIYLVVVFLPLIRKYQYIYYSDEGDNIMIRYFEAGIFGGKKNSVEINKKTFSGFKTDSSFFGLVQSVTLFQQYKEGVAKYPPVYISALSKRDRDKVIKSLQLLTPPV